MKYREVFEVNGGYRFYRHRISILVQAMAYGLRFSDDQIRAYTSVINRYLDEVSKRPPLERTELLPLTAEMFPIVSDRPFLKYVSDETLEFIRKGSFRFGSAEYYRAAENKLIKDVREGLSTFHIGSNAHQLHVSAQAGYNCLMYCGTAADSPCGDYMKNTFGTNIIRIENPASFAALACSLLGAKAWYIHDVVYTNLKNYILESPDIERFSKFVAAGSQTNVSLREMNRCFFELFYKTSFMPSLFSKPLAYIRERERRMVFELPVDIVAPTVTVISNELLSHVEIEKAPP